jgi:hypothetical protein
MITTFNKLGARLVQPASRGVSVMTLRIVSEGLAVGANVDGLTARLAAAHGDVAAASSYLVGGG